MDLGEIRSEAERMYGDTSNAEARALLLLTMALLGTSHERHSNPVEWVKHTHPIKWRDEDG